MNRTDLVVIGCGKAKRATPTPAADLYTGALRTTAVKWARSVDANILILSARYGLVPGDQVIAPYDERVTPAGRSRSVPDHTLAAQAAQLGINPGDTIALIGGDDYQRWVNRAIPDVTFHRPVRALARATYGDARSGWQARILIAHHGRWPATHPKETP